MTDLTLHRLHCQSPGDVDDDTTVPSDIVSSDGQPPPSETFSSHQAGFSRRYIARRRQYQIMKNLIVICIAFLLNFTAFQNIQNLQSSLNPDAGLGSLSLAITYGVLLASSLLLPSWLIHRLSCKWTMSVSLFAYILYVAANFYPTWYTVSPAAVLLGLGAAPLWTAKCTYLTESASQLAKITGECEEAVIGRFFGIFFLAFQSTQVWGSLIAGFVLHDVPENGTLALLPPDIERCGSLYCTEADGVNNTNLNPPDTVKVYTLLGTFLCLCLLAFLTLSLCLDRLPRVSHAPSTHRIVQSDSTDHISETLAESGKGGGCRCDLLKSTLLHWRDRRQLLLVPLTAYSGLQQSFIAGDYTRSYVSCTLGMWMVGMVMLCFGACNALASLALGHLVKVTGRTCLLVTGTLLHCGVLTALAFWQPNPDLLAIYFVLAGLWGLGDAVWQTQINSLYGCLFSHTKEAAFSNYRLWKSLGFVVGFAYNDFLCSYIKVCILYGMLALGMLGYFVVEYGENQRRRKSQGEK